MSYTKTNPYPNISISTYFGADIVYVKYLPLTTTDKVSLYPSFSIHMSCSTLHSITVYGIGKSIREAKRRIC